MLVKKITMMRWVLLGCFIVILVACSRTKEFVVLLPEDDGKTGTLTVAGQQETVTLNEPLSSAEISSRGHIGKHWTTESKVQETFAAALAAQPPVTKSYVLYFEMGSTDVAEESRPVLRALLDDVAQRQAAEVQVTGHTDRMGTVEDNDRLALERATAVRDMLVRQGLQASFIRAVSRGEREPLIPTEDEQEEPRNRRVEVIVR